MLYPLMLIVGIGVGWYLRGTRFAIWVYKWFTPDAEAEKRARPNQ